MSESWRPDWWRDVPFLAGKAALACALTLLLDRLLGNPDHVSSTFVAVLCISPLVIGGLRQAWAQLAASGLGGLWGTLATLAGLPPTLGVPLAVGLAIVTAFAAGAASGYPVAAFTALYLILVPQGAPLATFAIRLLAVASGAVGGLVVNLLISAFCYRGIFRHRVGALEARILALLAPAVRHGADPAEPGFAALATMLEAMSGALTELRWRRSSATLAVMEELKGRVERLREVLHDAVSFASIARRQRIDPEAVEPFAAWLTACAEAAESLPMPPPEPLPAPLVETAARMETTLRELSEGG